MSVQYTFSGGTAKEIATSFEAAMRSGDVAPGELLPTVRALAEDLGVAPGTVATAYKVLRDRGLIETRGRGGTFVRPRPPVVGRAVLLPVTDGAVDLASGQPDPGLLPDLGPLWVTAGGELVGSAAAPDELVLPELKQLARERLSADGVPVQAITLSSGGLDAIQRLLSAHLRPGDLVAVEDPGWPNLLDLVAALGFRVRPMALDHDGPLPEALSGALRAGARAVVVTSRAQNPTGSYLTADRAVALREVLAGHPEVLLIEDDHAAELAGVPLAVLAGATGSWAFVRSTSKPFGPDLRLAVVAGDVGTVGRLEGRMLVGAGWVSTLLQRLVVAAWTSPQVAASVAGAARSYQSRRTLLISDLAAHGIAATGATGLNVWVPVPDETVAVTGLARAGWAVAPGSRFRQFHAPGIRVTTSGLTEHTIPRLAADLAAVLGGQPSAGYSS